MSDDHALTPDADYGRFDALIFDCDGTLFDTMPAHFRVWVDTLSKYGIDFPEEKFYALGGVPAVGVVETLAREQDIAVDAERVAHEKELRFAEVGTDHVEPIGPVFDLVRRYDGVRPLAVATGGMRVVLDKILASAGVADLFAATVTADDVRRGKPDPETYLRAAELLGVDPTRCVAFEDADPGLQSARAAGMSAVDIRPWVAANRV